jgi:hypothetical protein
MSVAASRSSSTRATRVSPLLFLGLLFGLAVLLRLPYLWQIPLITDEYGEVGRALDLLDTGELSLTANAPYIGPLWIYTLAFGLALFLQKRRDHDVEGNE